MRCMGHSVLLTLSKALAHEEAQGHVGASGYLGKGGPLSLAFNGNRGGAAEEDLVDIFFAELGALVVLFHDSGISPLAKEVLYLLLGELLDLGGQEEAAKSEWED